MAMQTLMPKASQSQFSPLHHCKPELSRALVERKERNAILRCPGMTGVWLSGLQRLGMQLDGRAHLTCMRPWGRVLGSRRKGQTPVSTSSIERGAPSSPELCLRRTTFQE